MLFQTFWCSKQKENQTNTAQRRSHSHILYAKTIVKFYFYDFSKRIIIQIREHCDMMETDFTLPFAEIIAISRAQI